MAVIVIPVMTDDLDPSVCTHAATWGKVVTVAFGLDGVSFEIQLGDINEKALREISRPTWSTPDPPARWCGRASTRTLPGGLRRSSAAGRGRKRRATRCPITGGFLMPSSRNTGSSIPKPLVPLPVLRPGGLNPKSLVPPTRDQGLTQGATCIFCPASETRSGWY